ncbi:MAG: cytochrome BD ubiquinol oxidase subunit II, partial [Burkholderiaceae bacterium]|nr:cytochrome BD ubiquinol oxidase subunit II [Burkholderiaceae bacterium]
ATWLIMKTEGSLQLRAISWARASLWLTGLGIALISAATPYFSPEIMSRWFGYPNILWLAPIPIATAFLFLITDRALHQLKANPSQREWLPFTATVAIFWLSFFGIAYSLFPYLIVDRMTVWQAAASTQSLWVIFWGAIVVLPTILAYTLFSYRIFKGKTQPLSYY